ncbi:metal ABC transporter ATP-binding protein [Kosakonia sp. MUSA4]|uniref:metal ABC transporter ATP-binding protein n=1 Tax=Kosakonia sp. MUSA4 TaxID=2067958 RepID=UPI0008AAE21B|nr:ATP-binding cassette domain-containing protein [Kosakonia sp. MUSA4]QJT82185.1 ABC transporter ATP-binding protein [Kosakonia sp. MUSA4]SEK31787.1 zinc/manganese transport system ATP-binding protein [Kosakonia sacchari]
MIELDHLVAGYDRLAITPALCGTLERGSMTAIVGANGCGKSTLLKTLAGFLPPVSGVLRWQPSRPTIGWLAQRHALESQFPLTVQDVVCMGCWPRISLFRGLNRDARKRVAQGLERVGLTAMARETIDTLSGGQFQRMLFARVWVQNAPLVMLDEPFTGIDEITSQVLMEQIVDMHREGQTILAVLHDSERVARYFPQTLRLGEKAAQWGASAQSQATAEVCSA